MKKKETPKSKNLHSSFYLILVILTAVAGAGLISFELLKTEFEISTTSLLSTQLQKININTAKQKPKERVVKGIYLTAYSANSTTKLDSMIDLINSTELNAVVIDIKDYTGKVLYDSDVPLVNELGTEKYHLSDPVALIEKLHEHNIYIIARQTVFQDPILANKKPEWAIKNSNGGVWRDYKGLAWVDPTRTEIWEYNRDIAKEAMDLGFDEINFDYVRYPSDGPTAAARYLHNDRLKTENMGLFYQYLSKELSNESAYISLDFFGFVMERHDGMSIGQRLEDAVGEVDYISPMMYPSHYPSGHLGLTNPAANPYSVIDNGMKKGEPWFQDKRAKVRPWIQAFNIGAEYGAKNIRAQIDAIEKYPNAGWLLWNASNRYTNAGLKKE